MKLAAKIFSFLLGSLVSISVLAQGPTQSKPTVTPTPYFTFGKGLGIASPDSLFSLTIRFRMQNRLAFTSVSEDDLDIENVEARVRRLRLRFDGFIYSTKLTYVLQLAFSRADMDFDDTGFPNVIRDAMILYAVNDHLSFGLGQTKLPGNRQRVNSSGDLQLPDRSIVNSTFNVDRDFGVQAYYNNHFGGFHFVLRAAISTGEGRNITSSDNGLAYTGRVELLPFGRFTNNGDYFEGDLAREETPKVSIGISGSNNQNALRAGGQLGKYLYQSRDINTGMMDFLFKCQGWSLAGEMLLRNVINPVTENEEGDQRYVYHGRGENVQASYLFKNNLELVGRFSQVRPRADIWEFEDRTKQFTFGVTRYIKGHRLKLQSDLTYEVNTWYNGFGEDNKNWQLRFQIEAGI